MKLRLRTIRKINNYSQKDLANLLNVTQRTYSKYENSELSIKIEQLIKLSNFYHVSVGYLLGLNDNVNANKYSNKKFKNEIIINNLKYLRYENNLSQKALANKVNCSPSLISMIERNKSIIQVDMLASLSRFYNVDIDYLLFNKE